jgi:hypothetical protein
MSRALRAGEITRPAVGMPATAIECSESLRSEVRERKLRSRL